MIFGVTLEDLYFDILNCNELADCFTLAFDIIIIGTLAADELIQLNYYYCKYLLLHLLITGISLHSQEPIITPRGFDFNEFYLRYYSIFLNY